MVSKKEKEKWPFWKRIGLIRISSQELTHLLEKSVGDCHISASSKHHAFSSLDDIKENLALFVGNVEIRISPTSKAYDSSSLHISFGPCTTVGAYSSDQEVDTQIEKISRELRHYRMPVLGYLTIIPPFLWLVVFCLAVWALPNGGDTFPFNISWLSERANASIWLAILSLSLLAIAVSAIPSIFYNPRLSFWQRNRDAIVVGIIMLVIGVAFGEAVDFFRGPPEP